MLRGRKALPAGSDAFGGRIWRYGREAGIPTRVNATTTRSVRPRERVVGETSRR